MIKKKKIQNDGLHFFSLRRTFGLGLVSDWANWNLGHSGLRDRSSHIGRNDKNEVDDVVGGSNRVVFFMRLSN